MNPIIDTPRTLPSPTSGLLASATPQTTRAAAPDTVTANRVADAIISHARTGQPDASPAGAVQLQVPSRDGLSLAESHKLRDNLAQGNQEGISPAFAFANLERSALQALDAPTRDAIERAGGTVPRELMESARFMAVQRDAEVLIGLVSANGAIVMPTVRDLAALSGREPPTTTGQEVLRALLKDAPALRAVIDDLSALSEAELPVKMKTDPRLDYVLLLVAMLMTLAATQREQAASMLVFAERAVHAMGQFIVRGAEQIRNAKVLNAIVGTAVGVGGVALGGLMAHRNVTSIRTNQRDATNFNNRAAMNEYKMQSGAALTPGRLEPIHHKVLQREIINDQKFAAQANAMHSLNLTQNAVGTQAAQVIGQSANTVGSLAGTGHELEAAHLAAQQEKRRNDASTGQQVNQTMSQNAGKIDDAQAALFRQAQQAEQEKADTRNDIVRHMR